MIFNKNCYLISDIKTTLLPDILYPVHKLPGNTFIPELIGDCNIKRNSELSFIGNLPAGDILGNDLNIFKGKVNCRTVNCE